MNDQRPGLRIRRRSDSANATAVEPSETASADSSDEVPAPVTESAAPASPADAPARASRPAAVIPAPVSAGADARPERVWRAAVAAPAVDAPDEAPRELRVAGPPPTTDDFAAMFAGTPAKGLREFEVGERVSAPVVAFGGDSVFLGLGAKAEGVIDASELLDPDGELTVGIGDMVDAYVVSFAGGIRLSKALGRGREAGAALADAASNGIPVEGRVLGVNKGGFDVSVHGVRGFCPFSQIDITTDGDNERHVGQTYLFLVARVEEDGRNVVVSRAALLKRERDEQAVETLATLEPGAVFDGVVSRVADFGAFVDIGGVDGLVHVSELSWTRVEHPSEVVRVGDRVRVSVLSAHDLDGSGSRRIALSMKAVEEDPWVAAVREMTVGDTRHGVVARLEGFGAFVELAPGVDGLVHISEISPGRRINHPREVMTVGDTVEVQVLRIDPQKRQIALSMKALMDDPWTSAAEAHAIGSTVQGTVESVQSFGVLVALPSGINALIPTSHLPDDESRGARARYRVGAAVEARVLAVDTERRRLTLTRLGDEALEAAAPLPSPPPSAPRSLGTFADLLKGRS